MGKNWKNVKNGYLKFWVPVKSLEMWAGLDTICHCDLFFKDDQKVSTVLEIQLGSQSTILLLANCINNILCQFTSEIMHIYYFFILFQNYKVDKCYPYYTDGVTIETWEYYKLTTLWEIMKVISQSKTKPYHVGYKKQIIEELKVITGKEERKQQVDYIYLIELYTLYIFITLKEEGVSSMNCIF